MDHLDVLFHRKLTIPINSDILQWSLLDMCPVGMDGKDTKRRELHGGVRRRDASGSGGIGTRGGKVHVSTNVVGRKVRCSTMPTIHE